VKFCANHVPHDKSEQEMVTIIYRCSTIGQAQVKPIEVENIQN